MLYLRGIGCEQDFAAADQWCRRAADQADPGGALGLGIIREHGFVGAADPAEAARWYQLAVDAGNDAAATALGKLYLDGRGVAQNLVKAERLLVGPAARGSAFARQALTSLQSLRQKANA
jgi:TPR repeat protein